MRTVNVSGLEIALIIIEGPCRWTILSYKLNKGPETIFV